MLAHDPVRTRLREALEHSPAGRYLRGARALWADAWSHARMLSKTEIRGLEQRGNQCDDWTSVRVLGAGTLAHVRGCRFEGHNILRTGAGAHNGPRLSDSRIRDALVGLAEVERVALLDRVVVEDGAILRHVDVCAGVPDSRFCLGLAVHPGSEAGTRRVFLSDGLVLDDCAAMATLPPAEQDALAHEWTARLRACVADHACVGAGARIEFTRFVEDCYVGPGTIVRGATALRRCILGSAGDDPVRVGDGVIAEDCVLEAGVRLDSAAQARRDLFLEHSGAEHGAQVTDSVIGPNTHAAKGEITASLVGPFVGFHHQALLIGTLWPEGRGNVGYGANVGSNHTGRKPDQELRPGMGTFFGLGCAIKFPSDFRAAPFSLFATGVVAAPQRIAFPFSLVAPATEPAAPGLNEIMPGWMWGENAYALARNAYKFADRNRARRHAVPATVPPEGSPLAGSFLGSDLFAQDVSRHVLPAFELLAAAGAQPARDVYTVKELPGLGANFLRGPRLAKARAAYARYLAFVQCRIVLWNPEANPVAVLAAKNALAALEAVEEARFDAATLFSGFLESVEHSLAKDAERGHGIQDDYDAFHESPADDATCRRLRADLDHLLPVLRERLG